MPSGDPSRASGIGGWRIFIIILKLETPLLPAIETWSPYHGEDDAARLFLAIAQKTDRTRSSYWLVRPGSIHESLNCPSETRGRLPPVLSFFRGLLQRAMSPIVDEVSCIRPIASTYNVVITLIIPSIYSVVQRTVVPPTIKGRNIGTSLPFGSENLWRKLGFKFPRTARLYSQGEYAAPRIIPSAANVATKLLIWKAPTKMGNSPIELLVPGKLILAKVEENKMVGGFGMVLTEPP